MIARSVRLLLVSACLFAAIPSARAQEFRGRLTGTVTDTSGAILPGVTVTATSPALIQPQMATTGVDGTYRFPALPPGTYQLTFELAGFQTLRRTDIRVVINTELTMNAQLPLASVAESVTVTGESPVVDTSTTKVGTNFTKELLAEIPNARDIWAAMAQAPGLQVTGFDVGGSHTGTQTGYYTYGISQQNTTRIEGINTTEATSANAGYFDFGSFEEFQVGGAGNGADQDVPGASLNITVKSGGDRFSGTWYSDYEGKNLISDNVPDALRSNGGRLSSGLFVRKALARGNPVDRQYDLNSDVGGPIFPHRAWFFISYRLDNQYKTILNFPDLAQSKLVNYTGKGTFQLTKSNQIIGYWNKRTKLQDKRNLGPSEPLSAAYYQPSRNYPMKVEWTSVVSDHVYVDTQVSQWYNFFPLYITQAYGSGTVPNAQLGPGRFDDVTRVYADGGAADAYQDQKRFKPQFFAYLSYFKDGWRGSHAFKVGYDFKRDRRKFLSFEPFNIFYHDRNGAPDQVDIWNTPNESINDVTYNAAFVSDQWKVNSRLTINAGARLEHYKDGWPDQSFTPGGVPQLAGDPRFASFFAPVSVSARTVSRTTTVAPRVGFAYDLDRDGKTVLKAFYGRFYFNSADTIADNENPVGAAQLRYQFLDQNGNHVVDGPSELGVLRQTLGGAGFVKVDPNLQRPNSTEVSTNFERELREGLSGRVSYVYKNIRDEWAVVDLARVNAYTIPVTIADPGPDGVRNTGDDGAPITVYDRPAGIGENRVFTNPGDPSYDSDYHTIEFAVNRRFHGRWMLLSSFEQTWLKELYNNTSSTSSTGSAGNTKDYFWQPNQRRFGRETTTLWNYKLVGRYVAPFDIGISGDYKLQSGRMWGRSINAALPNAGSETIRVDPVDSHRAPNIHLVDLRLDKSFRVAGSKTRLVGMVDVFNLLNTGTPITFRTNTGTTFQEVTALLDPRVVRFGARFEF